MFYVFISSIFGHRMYHMYVDVYYHKSYLLAFTDQCHWSVKEGFQVQSSVDACCCFLEQGAFLTLLLSDDRNLILAGG